VTSATAWTVDATPGAVVFNAEPGEANDLTVTQTGTTITFVDPSDAIPAETHDNCTAAAVVTCTDAGTAYFTITINLGDMNDQTTFNGVTLSVTQNGEDGDDTLRGPTNATTSSGGPGTDRLESATAASSFSTLSGGTGPDTFVGGPGNDHVTYAERTAAVTVTIDGAPNDGELGEGDNVGSEIDDLTGGGGNDNLTGSVAANVLDGLAGNDTLSGGEGDDTLLGGAGADVFNGGAGIDAVFLSAFGPAPTSTPLDLTVTLDGAANDGAPGEGDNVQPDVEDVTTDAGNDSITGNDGFNILSAGTGNDTIDAGAGNDVLLGGAGNDTLRARDGYADRVECGPGTDTAVVDTLDTLGGCETVDRADVGSAVDDRPPTVAITSPRNGQRIPASGVDVSVTASDDRGVARVLLIDDGQTVGTDTAAPYAFRYQPTGDDVGRNTLIAVALDATGQAGTAIVTVQVNRFAPRGLSSRVTPSRDRTAPYRFRATGSLQLPTGVTRATGCGDGIVSVQVKRATRTISTRRVALRRDCSYSSTVTFNDRRRLGPTGRLRFIARFLGNEVLGIKTARSRTVRAG
jgi:Ca2+-binding RTX toxin-like protein